MISDAGAASRTHFSGVSEASRRHVVEWGRPSVAAAAEKMKVTVSFDAVRLVVPAGDGQMPVSWLIDQAVARYRKTFGKVYRYNVHSCREYIIIYVTIIIMFAADAALSTRTFKRLWLPCTRMYCPQWCCHMLMLFRALSYLFLAVDSNRSITLCSLTFRKKTMLTLLRNLVLFSRFSAFEVTTLWRYTNLCIIIISSTTIIITVVVFLFSFIFTPGINDPGIKN